MMNKNLKLPMTILTVGLVLAIVACLFTGVVKEPVIQEQDFPFSVTYRLDGETKTYEGVYNCRFFSTGEGISPQERYYRGTYLSNPSDYHSSCYTIAEKDGLELVIVTIFNDHYLMGDTAGVPESTFTYDPYIAVLDQEGAENEENLELFDVELISWEAPAPVENSFKFVGFSHLHATSMVAMLAVGLLTLVACMILVKRDKTVPYKALDKVSVVLNILIALVAIPFCAIIALAMQIYVTGDELSYQVALAIPAITAFTIAASLSLRRKGFAKASFFTQFVGPVLFALLLILE